MSDLEKLMSRVEWLCSIPTGDTNQIVLALVTLSDVIEGAKEELSSMSDRDELANIVGEMKDREKPGRSKLMLAIAEMNVRRGRELTEEEKMNNLIKEFPEADLELRV